MSRAAQPASTPASESRSGAPRRRLLIGVPSALGLGLAAVLLTGCGAGQITQTDTQSAAVNGASGQVGPMAVRNAELAYPSDTAGAYAPGSNAELTLTIVNTGMNADTLTGIVSPAAASVTIDGSPTGTKAIPGGFSVSGGQSYDDEASGAPVPTSSIVPMTPSSVDSSGTTTTGSTRTKEDTTATTGARSTGSPGSTEPTGPAASLTQVAPVPSVPGKISVELMGLKTVNGGSLRDGLTIPVTFRFANAGEVTVYVPVGAPGDNENPDTVIASVPANGS